MYVTPSTPYVLALVISTDYNARQISKGVNKAVLLYVEQTVTVHFVLFYL